MQQINFNLIRKAVSAPRLEIYRLTGGSDFDTVVRFLWNQRLCEAFYTVLQNLEVTLRNGVHDVASDHFGSLTWFDRCPLTAYDRDAVAAARQELTRQRKPHDPGRIVAELGFGFWAGLFRAEYDRVLWPYPLVRVFPGISTKRATLSGVLQQIRMLRNRVFHHERILHRHLQWEHQKILTTLGWISPAMRDLVAVNDHFPHVLKFGRNEIASKLRDIFPLPDYAT